jgi:hypothetical protein
VEPSGLAWVRRFPGSVSLDDLTPGFRDKADAFVRALRYAGAKVRITATWRPPERAWLMYWCCRIAKKKFDPAKVPHVPGIDIDWQHIASGAPDLNVARTAALAMQNAYNIQYPPALVSRHTQRRAIDMTIGWKDHLCIEDSNGKTHMIVTRPHTGQNYKLIEVAKTYGVVKLFKDPPHWSDDGR